MNLHKINVSGIQIYLFNLQWYPKYVNKKHKKQDFKNQRREGEKKPLII